MILLLCGCIRFNKEDITNIEEWKEVPVYGNINEAGNIVNQGFLSKVFGRTIWLFIGQVGKDMLANLFLHNLVLQWEIKYGDIKSVITA